MVETTLAGKAAFAQQSGKYDPKTDPLAPNEKITEIASALSGTDAEIAKVLFDLLHKGAELGVKVVKGDGRPPRTASETLEKGGDCTELATLATSILKGASANGGVLVVHFAEDPESLDHMVPYVETSKGRLIIDLQASKLGTLAKGKYSIIMELTFEQSIEMYHREWGDHLRDKGKAKEAIIAYERAIAIYDKDAYVHQNLGILYEKAGNMAKSTKHFSIAASLDPKYKKDSKRGSYNDELSAGVAAFKAHKWDECIGHFQAALDSGQKFGPGEKEALEQNITACKNNKKKTQGSE
jgi:tetratricopeptide (TPR) repeat protein